MKLRRDRLTWVVYGQLSVYGFFLGAFGPSQSLLRDIQQTSRTVAGLHGTALAAGTIIVGFVIPRVLHRFGRKKALWGGILALCIAAAELLFITSIYATLSAALLAGFGGGLLAMTSTRLLLEHHGKNGNRVFLESAAVAALTSAIGTIIVGSLAGTSIDWRLGFVIIILMSIILRLIDRTNEGEVHVPDPSGPAKGKLPLKFWLALLATVSSIACEMGTSFWASSLIQANTGASAANSTFIVTIFFAGMFIGRWVGSVSLQKLSLDNTAFLTLGITVVGYFILWSAHTTPLAYLGLGVIGLGLSVQYPVGVARAVLFAPQLGDVAVGRISIGTGISVATGPLLLGFLGDHFGVSRGFLMLPAIIVVAFVFVMLSPTKKLV